MMREALGAVLIFGGLWAWWRQWRADKLESLTVDTTQRQGIDYGADVAYSLDYMDYLTLANAGQMLTVLDGSRGLRNNNPGNIEYTGVDWTGLAEPPSDGRFCRFIAPEYGIRAMYRVLMQYRARGINTIRGIVATWAPDHENDTDHYIQFVAGKTGYGPDRALVSDGEYIRVMAAMVEMENGRNPYTWAQYQTAIELYPDQVVTAEALQKIEGMTV